MKTQIIHIGKQWKSYSKKIKQLQEWFKPVADMTYTVSEIKEMKLPFVQVGEDSFAVDPKWLRKNITIDKDAHAVIVTIPRKLWKGKDLRGYIEYGTPHIIQVGGDDTDKYSYKGKVYQGGRWFNIARHEQTHMLYRDRKMKDNTHMWWELGRIEESLKELTKKPTPQIPLQVQIGIDNLNVKEFVGKANNPVILNWAKECGIPYYEDDTAWCSLFMNWTAMKAKLPRTNKLNARSWLDIGTKVSKPRMGDVVVFWREHKDSWKGHVGWYISDNGKSVMVLGGNQNDSVSLAEYPLSRVLGYRRL